MLPQREDSSKNNYFKIDEDSNSKESNSSLAFQLIEGAQLIDIMKKIVELEKKDLLINSTYQKLTEM